MKTGMAVLLASWLLGLTACGSLMHPRATEIYNQAKGPTGVETGLNLVGMMEKSLQQAMTESGDAAGLDALHDQFHALHRVFCDMTEVQTQTMAYVHSVTLEKEMRVIFHRLWKYRDDQKLRNLHLGLFAARLAEFRLALQDFKG